MPEKILFTGGGTLGSVTPLLAIKKELESSLSGAEFFWLGTKSGPEREIIEDENIKFKGIFGGKLRRYFSWKNFIDPFLIIIGFFQSLALLTKIKPDIVITAGSFVSVPVIYAACFLRVPALVCQLDVRAGLANKLMAPCAKKIAVSFEKSEADYGRKAVYVGLFARPEIKSARLSAREARQKLGINEDVQTVLVLGGGTGSSFLNSLVYNNMPELSRFCQIIHITGKGKAEDVSGKNDFLRYKGFEFLNTEGLIKVYAAADIVVTRCGLGALSELSALGKPAILVPMPDSHQEDNAKIFTENNAAVILDQKNLSGQDFVRATRGLLGNKDKKEELSRNIKSLFKKDAAKEVALIVERVMRNA